MIREVLVRWVGGWIDGWMGRQVSGWVGGWLDGEAFCQRQEKGLASPPESQSCQVTCGFISKLITGKAYTCH